MIARTLLTTEYKLLRLPLTVLEGRVVGRLDEESRVRLGFERTLGALDSTVGRLVGDEALSRRGAKQVHRAEILTKAVTLEEKAELRRAVADEVLTEGQQEAERERRAAEERARAEAQQVLEHEQQAKQAAAQKAKATAKARAKSAEQKAEARLSLVEERADEQALQVKKRTKARTAAPKAQLEEAAELSAIARKERAAAEKDSRRAAKA